jgi:hypothetical protein
MSESLRFVVHLKYPTHYSYVFQREGSEQFHCIKYNDRKLEWTFHSDLDHCKEHMISELSSQYWGFEEE